MRPSLTPAEAFDFLVGRWHLEREVAGQAMMQGELRVVRIHRREATYTERVTVRTAAGGVFSGSQQYRVLASADGFSLCFGETGAVFQELRFLADEEGVLQAGAMHACGQDRYETTVVLGPGRRFRVRHVVAGPRKAYVSETQFSDAL